MTPSRPPRGEEIVESGKWRVEASGIQMEREKKTVE